MLGRRGGTERSPQHPMRLSAGSEAVQLGCAYGPCVWEGFDVQAQAPIPSITIFNWVLFHNYLVKSVLITRMNLISVAVITQCLHRN